MMFERDMDRGLPSRGLRINSSCPHTHADFAGHNVWICSSGVNKFPTVVGAPHVLIRGISRMGTTFPWSEKSNSATQRRDSIASIGRKTFKVYKCFIARTELNLSYRTTPRLGSEFVRSPGGRTVMECKPHASTRYFRTLHITVSPAFNPFETNQGPSIPNTNSGGFITSRIWFQLIQSPKWDCYDI